jgi:hypothetical protein
VLRKELPNFVLGCVECQIAYVDVHMVPSLGPETETETGRLILLHATSRPKLADTQVADGG